WGHDTTRDTWRHCSKCDVDGAWVMIERDGSLHGCFSGSNTQTPYTPDEPQISPSTPSVPGEPAGSFGGVQSNGNAAQVAELFGQLVNLMAPKVDRADVQAMINDGMATFKADMLETVGGVVSDKLAKLTLPTSVKVERPNLPDIEIKNAHKSLPLVLT